MKKSNHNRQYMVTYPQLIKLEEEMMLLKAKKRKEVASKIREYQEDDDLSYGSRYDLARKEQRQIEERINELENMFENMAVIIDDYEEEIEALDTVLLGCQVKLYDMEYDEEVILSIVSPDDANSLHNKISDESPMGMAMIGKRVGDLVKVHVGKVVSQYEILAIEGMEPGYVDELDKYISEKEISERAVKEELIEIKAQDFLTRVNVFKCSSRDHKLIDIRCRIRVLTKNGEIATYIVPGAHCETCNKYYILETEYLRLKQKGILVCRVVEQSFWTTHGNEDNYFNLNQESLLHIMGYNVNAQSNLTNEQRWGLLELLVDEEVLSVVEIRSHLNWLIRRNANNSNFREAREKWEIDSSHMMDYVSKNQEIVDVKSVSRNRYKKR